MADRGFVINDFLEPLGCTLNIPPFLNNQIKTFKIVQNVFPINQAGLLNQIWTVCALLVNFQSPIIAQ